jgi:O-antigen/teichoic acid export membrane protein
MSYLGSTAYGLVVFHVTLLASVQVLDSGLSPALSRELSLRLAGHPLEKGRAESAANLARTVEILSIITAALIGIAVVFAAPLIATRWLRSDGLASDRATEAVRLIGAVIAVQWPSIAYQAAISGLQQQVKLNTVKLVTSSLQAIGLVVVLAWLSPTPRAYFLWVLLVQAINTIWLRSTLWRSLGGDGRAAPRFDWAELVAVWRFAAGMAGFAFLSTLLTQTDKIILSKIVPLSEFGAYGVAYTVCSALSLVASPVFMAAVPRFTQIISLGEFAELRSLYLAMCELVALMVVPVWMVLAFHANELMALWMGAGREAGVIAGLLPVIGTGWLANALVTLPLGLQIASGWTSLSVYKNLIAVAIVVPGLMLVAPRYGTIGAAFVWLALNLGYVALEIPIMHRRLLRGSALRWYVRGAVVPVAAATAVGLASKELFGPGLGKSGSLIAMLVSAAITALALVALLPSLRGTVVPILTRFKSGWA